MIAKMELICAEIWFIRNFLVCFLYTRNNIQFDLKNFSFDQSFFFATIEIMVHVTYSSPEQQFLYETCLKYCLTYKYFELHI